MGRSLCFTVPGFRGAAGRGAMALALVLAAAPSSVSALGPSPDGPGAWLEAHRRVEYGAIPASSAVLARWLRSHLDREYDVDRATLAGQLRQHVLRENGL